MDGSKLITIALVAWPNHPARWKAFLETLASLRRHLTATGYAFEWVCSSESQADPMHKWYGSELNTLCDEEHIRLQFRQGTPGLGENMNAALQMCTGEYILLVQDDRPLLKPLDLAASVALLERLPEIAVIRYAWPQGRDVKTGQHRCKLMTHPDGWRRFCVRTGWLYGDEPHLRHRSYMSRFGWYLEGVRHGACEGEMLYRLRRAKATVIAADDIYFGHNSADVSAVINDTRVQGGNR